MEVQGIVMAISGLAHFTNLGPIMNEPGAFLLWELPPNRVKFYSKQEKLGFKWGSVGDFRLGQAPDFM